MKNGIKLTKNGIGGKVMLSKDGGEWITNGAWAIKRDMVESGELMTTPAAVGAILKLKPGTAVENAPDVSQLLKCYDSKALKQYSFTGWLKERSSEWSAKKEYAYCYESEDGQQIFLDKTYVDMLSPMFCQSCYAVSPSTQAYPALFDRVADVTCILMPLRLPSFNEDKAERERVKEADKARFNQIENK